MVPLQQTVQDRNLLVGLPASRTTGIQLQASPLQQPWGCGRLSSGPSLQVAPLTALPVAKAADLLTTKIRSESSVSTATGRSLSSSSESQEDRTLHRLEVGCYTRAGQKLDYPAWTNQDAHLVAPLGEGRTIVAIFDGHGSWGTQAASLAREVVSKWAPRLIPKAPEALAEKAAASALRQLFELAHRGLAAEHDAAGRQPAAYSGCTATIAIVDSISCQVHSAHAGDSSLVVAAGGEVKWRTTDHKVDDAAEQRIIAKGGEVTTYTISGVTARRVCFPGSRLPGLAMARALGDLVAQDLGICWEPEIHTGIALAPGASVVIASDGVWDMTTDDEVARLTVSIAGGAGPQDLSQSIVEISRSRWPSGGNIDDITALVVRWPGSQDASWTGPGSASVQPAGASRFSWQMVSKV